MCVNLYYFPNADEKDCLDPRRVWQKNKRTTFRFLRTPLGFQVRHPIITLFFLTTTSIIVSRRVCASFYGKDRSPPSNKWHVKSEEWNAKESVFGARHAHKKHDKTDACYQNAFFACRQYYILHMRIRARACLWHCLCTLAMPTNIACLLSKDLLYVYVCCASMFVQHHGEGGGVSTFFQWKNECFFDKYVFKNWNSLEAYFPLKRRKEFPRKARKRRRKSVRRALLIIAFIVRCTWHTQRTFFHICIHVCMRWLFVIYTKIAH